MFDGDLVLRTRIYGGFHEDIAEFELYIRNKNWTERLAIWHWPLVRVPKGKNKS